MKYGDSIQGDTVVFNKSVKLKIEVTDLKGTTLKLVTDNGERILSKNCNEFKKDIDLEYTKFAYIMATKGRNVFPCAAMIFAATFSFFLKFKEEKAKEEVEVK